MPKPAESPLARRFLVATAVAFAIVNGQPFSPYFDPVLFWLGKLAGRAWMASPVVFHGASVVIAVLTLCLSAIPALLFRLAAGRWIGGQWLAAIWLSSTIALSWPTLRIVLGLGD